ncbi:uncharacterized protein V6R79_023227 [Siganus canaliculatus]
MWSMFDLEPGQKPPTTTSAAGSYSSDGSPQGSSSIKQVEAKAVWTAVGCLAVPDYRPLDVFSGSAELPGSASWDEAEEQCELSIRLKEFELCDLIGETPVPPKSE